MKHRTHTTMLVLRWREGATLHYRTSTLQLAAREVEEEQGQKSPTFSPPETVWACCSWKWATHGFRRTRPCTR